MQSNKRQRRSHSGVRCSINAVRACAGEDSTNDNSSVGLLGNHRSNENGDIDGILSLPGEQQDEDSIGAGAMNENDAVVLPVLSFTTGRCCNCRRTKTRAHTEQAGLPDFTVLQCSVREMLVHRRLKFCCIDFSALQHADTAMLCCECNTHLLGPTLKQTGRTVWPACIWKILAREDPLE